MVFYIQVFGSAKFEIKHKMVLENYFKNNILGSLVSSCHKEELWNKDYNGIFFNFGCSYSKFSYCWSDSWTCLYFIFWGQGQQRKWRNEESVSTPGYQKFSWVFSTESGTMIFRYHRFSIFSYLSLSTSSTF